MQGRSEQRSNFINVSWKTSHGEEYVIDRSLIFRLYNIITQIQASHGGTSANLTKFTS